MRKQMEGDNRERRKKARDARREGTAPSAAHVTTGASKQDDHRPRRASQDEKMAARREGKQGGAVQERYSEPRPSAG